MARAERALVLSTAVLAAGTCRRAPPPPARAPTVTADPPAESLRVAILAPATVPAGAPVPVTIRLTNATDRPLELHFLGRNVAFDIVVTDDQGTVVWRRLDGQTVPAILQVKMLAPADSLELRDVWRQRTNAGTLVAPGDYTVQGVLPSDAPEPLRTPARTVRIESRG